jgi:hypothetical protein
LQRIFYKLLMRSKPFLRIVIFLLFCTLPGVAQESGALNYLNALREKSGLTPLRADDLLDKAASAHAGYLLRQQKAGHFEKKGYKGFTGENPSARVSYQGFASRDVMENVTVNSKDFKGSVDKLFSAIYHRFVFLSFDKDIIGIGRASSQKKKDIQSAYVYKLADSALNSLCQDDYIPVNGGMYMQYICRDKDKLIPQNLYEQTRIKHKAENPKVILYPYPGQKELLPVFYNEDPDPLPDYQVSGYPISVQLNDAYYRSVKLKSFKLYDERGKEFAKTRVLSSRNDPHKRFKKTEFALMPLKRLEYAQRYTAVFEATVDGKKYQKKWSFSTRSFKEKLYRLTGEKLKLKVAAGSTVILYFVPRSGNDMMKSYRFSESLKVVYVDYNTLKVTLPAKLRPRLHVEAGDRKVVFE